MAVRGVTKVDPLLSYILSSSEARARVTDERRQQVAEQVRQIITTQGYFHITKDTGIFLAHN